MFKKGFTLAEVLITLSIVGIISALTIPTFVANSQNKANASKLASAINSIENAFTSMIAAEGVSDLSETEFGLAFAEENNTEAITKLSNYLKSFGGEDKSLKDYYGDEKLKYINGKEYSPNGEFCIKTKSGFLLSLRFTTYSATEDFVNTMGGTVYSPVGDVVIDVNDTAKPNIYGRDIFEFMIGEDGMLYPYGSLNVSIFKRGNIDNVWNKSGSGFICTDSSKEYGCTARLVENNFVMDY